MKKYILTQVIFLVLSASLAAQDCFSPATDFTIYTTSNPKYGVPALSGFTTASSTMSGSWNVVSSQGVSLDFNDNTGRRATFEVSGSGTISIENEVTNISTSEISSCVQSINVRPFMSQIMANNPLVSPCPLHLVVVLDESESIASTSSSQIVRDAVKNLVARLEGNGNTIAMVEFESTARLVELDGNTNLQEINSTILAAVDSYLSTGYDPISDVPTLVGGTNWEDALLKANSIEGANMILLLTDGRPTFYNTIGAASDVAGEGLNFDLTALKRAQNMANQIKASGKHMLVAGLNFTADKQPIIDISGQKEYVLGEDPSFLFSSDYTLTPPSELGSLFSTIGQLCSAEPIPTLSEWSLICLSLLLAIVMTLAMKGKCIHLMKTELS